ncbi:phenylalanine--tRNA ligase beta subunit [endosymbiont of Euscepes postfasciatus]|uniref:hypothetical protein n=1 Tax=endosymbiont of Euscepes postfasciatus TaxID=650377 RepID=UPI000DC72DE5|nr:hypothetical protein [endosymbiont of Euscepes postfasciatus]BBA84663.1 phenylalanine--tRNA ligase beta subunit [endosymbiont of Euscepes postfasciatus]
MRFSLNLIKNNFITETKVNLIKLINNLKKIGIEINSKNKIFNNKINIFIGKIIFKKKNKNNIFLLKIKSKYIKLIDIYTNISIFKKGQIILLIKEISNINKENKYYISNNVFFKLNIKKIKIGTNINKFININKDTILDISIPFNRPDCTNILGLLREINKTKFLNKYKNNNIKNICNNDIYKIDLDIKCNNFIYYYNYIIKDLNINNSTSIIIKNILNIHNINIKNNIEDIVKYVFLQTGYYVHIIDYEFIKNNKIIIECIKNEKNECGILNIKNNNFSFIPNIENNIFINKNTKEIFIGCIIFIPNNINDYLYNKYLKNNYYKLLNNTDPFFVDILMNNLSKLIINTYGGICKNKIKIFNNKIKNKIININFDKIRKIIGLPIRNCTIINILKKIYCKYKIIKNNLTINIPYYRSDLNYEEDIIEEVLKNYNINNIPCKKILSNLNINNYDANEYLNKIKNFLVFNGYNEVINFSISNSKLQKIFYKKNKFVYIKNPLSNKLNTMRISLLTGLLNNVIYNINRKIYKIKIFEIGNCFENNNKFIETEFLSTLNLINNDFIKNDISYDNIFNKIKSEIEDILLLFINNNDFFFKKKNVYFLNKNNSIYIYNKKKILGILGILNNKLIKNKNINNYSIIYSEINLSYLKNIKKNIKNNNVNNNISKFNLIDRDISIEINLNINIDNIIASLYSYNSNIYKIEIKEFYIKNNNKCLLLRIYIKYIKHIKNSYINKFIISCLEYLKKKFNIYYK